TRPIHTNRPGSARGRRFRVVTRRIHVPTIRAVGWDDGRMKLMSRSTQQLEGSVGVARISRNTGALLDRVGHGDVVILDQVDLDRSTANALVTAGVMAVVNAAPSVSGRYPNLGPEILLAEGITLV